jgi:hypothetical protein
LQSLADKKKGITDEDLLALVGDEVHQAAVVWELVDLQVRPGASGDGNGNPAIHCRFANGGNPAMAATPDCRY